MAMQSSLKNMVIVLGSITLVSSAAVGGIYLLTKEPIEAAQIKKVNDAIALVMPEFDNVPSEEAIVKEADGENVNVYPATLNGEPVGYAIETFSKNGFGGKISLMVGFLPDGTIKDISVISQNETPGLGDKIQKSKSNFAVQFEGKNPATFKLAVKKDGGDDDAITASTISSRAFTDAVQRAYNILQAVLNDTQVEATSGATAKAEPEPKKEKAPVSKPKPQEPEEEKFEFDPTAVKGALPYDANSGATASAENSDSSSTQKGGE